MRYEELLQQVIHDGIQAAERNYADQTAKKLGAVQGFSACRRLGTEEISQLLRAAQRQTEAARRAHSEASPEQQAQTLETYWYHRCYELEVEWVANVVSVVLRRQGRPTLVSPTTRAYAKALEVLGSEEAIVYLEVPTATHAVYTSLPN